MNNAALLLDALRVASSLLAFARGLSDDKTVLEALVKQAHEEGREVDGSDVKTSIDAMDAARAELLVKLGVV